MRIRRKSTHNPFRNVGKPTHKLTYKTNQNPNNKTRMKLLFNNPNHGIIVQAKQ
jgi:hypothetical protein